LGRSTSAELRAFAPLLLQRLSFKTCFLATAVRRFVSSLTRLSVMRFAKAPGKEESLLASVLLLFRRLSY
jgi:hypothetical protein